MKLLIEDIAQYGLLTVELILKNTGAKSPGEALQVLEKQVEDRWQQQDFYDWMACLQMASEAKTIIFPTETIRDFIRLSKKHRVPRIVWNPPYSKLIIQFTEPILESEFLPEKTTHGWEEALDITDDTILGIITSRDYQDESERWLETAIAYYRTNSLQRVAWWEDNDRYNVLVGDNVTKNRERLRDVSTAIMLFLNAENVRLDKVEFDEKVNAKRIKKGKRELKPYYTCYVHKYAVDANEVHGSGAKHSFTYTVRGHFRHYKSGKVVWVHDHMRGLEHLDKGIVPKIYKVQRDATRSNPGSKQGQEAVSSKGHHT